MQKKYSLIRTIYLYTFATLGLVLLTIGSVRFVDMGLKVFVFTKAEEQERISYKQPLYAPYPLERIGELESGEVESKLNEKEKEALKQWLQDYESWKEQNDKIDPITSRRHRDASFNFALILVGLPLYVYHWQIAKKETKNGMEDKSTV